MIYIFDLEQEVMLLNVYWCSLPAQNEKGIKLDLFLPILFVTMAVMQSFIYKADHAKVNLLFVDITKGVTKRAILDAMCQRRAQ